MKQIATWLAGHRLRLVAMVTAFVGITFLSGLSPVLLVFAHLRKGVQESAAVAGLSAVLLLTLYWAAGIQPGLMLGMLAGLWLPPLLLAEVMRRSGSLSWCTQVATAVALVGVLMVFALTDDLVVRWTALLQQVLVPALESTGASVNPEAISAIARIATGTLVAAVVFGALTSVFIGRWLQTLLLDGTTFADEFLRLSVGKVIGIASAAIFALAAFSGNLLVENLAPVLLGAMMFQGLAVIHFTAAARKVAGVWLVPLYVLLMFVPRVAMVVAVVGFLDLWFDLRRRLAGAQGEGRPE